MIRPSVPHARARGRSVRLLVASSVLGAVVLATAAGACSSSGSGAAGDTTLSPSVQPSAVTFTTVHDDATVPFGPAASSTLPGGTMPADPQVQAFCAAVRDSTDDQADGGADDQALERYKATFRELADLAPTSIKPEATAMSNTIQQVASADDLGKLDDPNFTAQQTAVADWVGRNCGFGSFDGN